MARKQSGVLGELKSGLLDSTFMTPLCNALVNEVTPPPLCVLHAGRAGHKLVVTMITEGINPSSDGKL